MLARAQWSVGRHAAAAAVLLHCVVASCTGYPTSLNSIPTAETVGAGSLLLEVTNYGYPRMLTTESVSGVLLQLGVGDRLEFGIDRYETEETSEAYFNVKARLVDETDKLPGLAIGVMDLRCGCFATPYAVVSKRLGSVRVHVGSIHGSYSGGIMAGVDADVGSLWFGIDYLPGTQNHTRLGISRAVGSDTSVLVTFGIPNSKNSGKAEVGITVSTTLPMRK
ncbi:MAG: YjbH domain-containing protein [Armatimonadota bacterium]|nr:YjbH domain-containing protein [Armatimonadota bacterium]